MGGGTMRLFIYLILLFLITSAPAVAACSKDAALQWKYAPYVNTRSGNITKFTHPTEPQPTTAEEFAVICNDYTSYKIKVDMVDGVKAEGLRRVHAVDDSITSLGKAIRYAKNLGRWQAEGKTLTADESSILAIATVGRDAIVFIKTTATESEIASYDPLNDPNWPL